MKALKIQLTDGVRYYPVDEGEKKTPYQWFKTACVELDVDTDDVVGFELTDQPIGRKRVELDVSLTVRLTIPDDIDPETLITDGDFPEFHPYISDVIKKNLRIPRDVEQEIEVDEISIESASLNNEEEVE